ncbi:MULTISPECIES: amidohydrolase [Tsukamurella]|uniref:Amidohydrolase n=2 Tax=Tsukamurella TaxID=2060 RepID=A0A5C5S0E0_9ACTN|nr:amidohydrolase [Tsukamurella columbiensis]NMD55505.1 amidohydrolase [Tsukamurella columbiensis]TWS28128.1 amidohydrolase [Tsukamurella conjunctivitidis]
MDPEARVVEAILVRGDRVVASGTIREVGSAAGTAARRVDLPGATVIPGLIESHVHPVYTGLTQDWVDCRSPLRGSIADIQGALRARLATPGWVRGWGYDDTLLAEGRHPTRDELDAVSRDRPTILQHISAHFLVANSAALAAAGITETTVAQDDPRFPRDENGRLTGLAWEIEAVSRVVAAVPPLTSAGVRGALLSSLRLARSRGITTLHDLGIGLMAGSEELAAYRDLSAGGRLPVHVVGFLCGDQALPAIADGSLSFEPGPSSRGRFRLAGAKFWSDGSIQGLSAALRVPYMCDPGHCGDLLHAQEDLDDMVARVHRVGGQAAVHANGDAAVRATITALARAQATDGRRARHRIEHCQVTESDDLDAIVAEELGVSFFANHVYYWGDRHRDRFLGAERAREMDPLARADALGIRFGLHSDCPITPMDPLHTIRTASTRLTSGGDVLGEAQRISPERGIRAMTLDSAFLVHEEQEVGSLEPGRRADLVVLDAPVTALGDPSATMPRPVRVMVDGRWDT